MKRALALIFALVVLPLGALCEAALPEPEAEAPQMLLGEATAEYFAEVTLHYAASDGVSLAPASRTLLVQSGETLLDVALEALLEPTGGAAQASVVPGDARVVSREVSGGLVTVDLSIDARNVQSEQELLRMYLGIAATLLELDGVEGVNVLIGGREEGLLGLPCGVFTGAETDVAAVWAQMQAESDRYLGDAQASVTRTAALYFPSADGQWLMSEMREVTFTRATLVDTLIEQLCVGPVARACARPIAGGELLAGEPVLTVTDAGERVLQINLRGEALDGTGVERWQLCGALTLTLCSFCPELDAVRVSIDGAAVEELQVGERTVAADAGGLRRRDLSGRIGGAARLYLANESGELVLREAALSQGEALSPRALLEALLNEELAGFLGAQSPLPRALDGTDILGVRVRDGVATVDLSARFYSACQELDEARERTAVYAVVNTLCGLTGVQGVRFLFEGEQVETLSEYIYMRTTLLPNFGAVVAE